MLIAPFWELYSFKASKLFEKVENFHLDVLRMCGFMECFSTVMLNMAQQSYEKTYHVLRECKSNE